MGFCQRVGANDAIYLARVQFGVTNGTECRLVMKRKAAGVGAFPDFRRESPCYDRTVAQ